MSSITARVKEEHKLIVSVKSEYAAGYDPVKDEDTEDEEDDLLGRKLLLIKNEDDGLNIKADDNDTDDECCRGKLVYQRYMRELLVCGINI